MKIVVKDPGGKNFCLRLPSRLVLNRPAVALWYAFGGEMTDSLPCTKAQLFALIKTLHACRRQFPDWTLVEVTSADGAHVKVKL